MSASKFHLCHAPCDSGTRHAFGIDPWVTCPGAALVPTLFRILVLALRIPMNSTGVTDSNGFNGRRPGSAADGGGPADPQLAERLGLPSSYDARFRVNVSVLILPERLGTAARAIARRMAQRAATAGGHLPKHGQGRQAAGGSAGGSRDGGNRGSGGSSSAGGGVTSEIVEAASQVRRTGRTGRTAGAGAGDDCQHSQATGRAPGAG
jgi:hypothetical protein